MDEHVDIRDSVRQKRISDIEYSPGDVGHISALIVDGHDSAETRRRGDLRQKCAAETRGRAGNGDDREPGAF
ncbi:hypothetical protein GCM10017673_42580 [Streptosporangium violaceochromogenes]|nr:hypothetical protein GCM10017673_42580 [Streptosporangium violaceochromogenes]